MRRFVVASLVVSLVTLVFISGYLLSLLSLSSGEWVWFGKLLLVFFPLLFGVTQITNQRGLGPIMACLRAEESGGAGPQELRAGFRSVSRLPLFMFFWSMVWWTVGGVLVAAGMKLRFVELPAYVMTIMCLAAVSGGFLSSTFHYFINKSICRELLEALAMRLPDRRERSELVSVVTLRHKLLVSVTGVSLVIVVFSLFLALVRSGRHIEQNATRVQTAYLGSVLGALEVGELPDGLAVSAQAHGLRIADEIVLLDVVGDRVLQGDATRLSATERELVARSAEGDSSEVDSANVLSWMRVPGTDVAVVAISSWDALRGDRRELWIVFGLVILVCTAIALGLAHSLSRDVATRTRDLKEAAERVASGDLRRVELLEGEDELGELARAFEGMSSALREAVAGVADAANLVEATAGEIASITESVSGGAAAQSRGVEEAARTMERINAEVSGISGAAGELNGLVENSSSSILAMGAAGQELNDTAGVLSSRVEEVSTSIEQMVRSVTDVNSHTGALSEAANDTSSSMEEMASAMRQVDTIAEQAAGLSRDVVVAAEGGRETVRQTIEGMESIREATDGAQRVVEGLARRAQEIGSILDVIDDVAEETNLLALNAAIIAAQAGDQGRSFSVVADEIKELADRVLASTKEIGSLIRAVQEESGNAAGAIAAGATSVANGMEWSSQAGTALEEITRSSRESGARIQEIVLSVQEQSKAASHVVAMMERVNGGVEAIHRATEEQNRGNDVVYRSMVAMREVAQQLRVTTVEQARGGVRIRESIEGVRNATEAINQSLQAQSGACQAVVGFLEDVSTSSRGNGESSSQLAEAARALLGQAEALREGVRRFVIDA